MGEGWKKDRKRAVAPRLLLLLKQMNDVVGRRVDMPRLVHEVA